jgi:hypothetical protein
VVDPVADVVLDLSGGPALAAEVRTADVDVPLAAADLVEHTLCDCSTARLRLAVEPVDICGHGSVRRSDEPVVFGEHVVVELVEGVELVEVIQRAQVVQLREIRAVAHLVHLWGGHDG